LDRKRPGAVVLPRHAADLSAAVRLAWTHRVPYVARGAGTNLCGGATPAEGGLILHLSRMNRILSIDPKRRRAWVEPGVVNLRLQDALAPHGLFYAPDPASQKACTLGGNVGTNAGGPHCLKHGVTTHHVTALDVILPDGTPARFSIDESGCDLTGFFVGSEGTLGIAARLELALRPLPADIRTFLAPFPSLDAAAQTVTDIISDGILPTTLEVMDRLTIDAVEDFTPAGYPRGAEAVLLIEIDGEPARLDAETVRIETLCRKNGAPEFRRARDEAERQKLWEGRRGAYPAMARLAPNVLVEDGVVPRTRLPEAVRRIRAIAARDGLRMGLIAHAGDGNLHPNLIFDERDPAETARVKAAGQEMMRVCVDLGGSISGEHGIGADKREAMRWLFTPPTLRLFRRLKNALDPENLCNPDKLIPAASPEAETPASESLRPLPAFGDLRPARREDVAEIFRAAQRGKQRIVLYGTGTKSPPCPPGALAVHLAGLNRVVELDRANFTLTVEAGARLAELRRDLAAQGLHLHLPGGGSIGGALSSGLRLADPDGPSARVELLGLKAVLMGGDEVVFGGKVVKNVAGYDAAKLFLGAWGTLGAIVEVTLRLHALPAPEDGVVVVPHRSGFRRLPTGELHHRLKRVFDPGNLLNSALYE
jgi:glycolate oxidase subunit GlcD